MARLLHLTVLAVTERNEEGWPCIEFTDGTRVVFFGEYGEGVGVQVEEPTAAEVEALQAEAEQRRREMEAQLIEQTIAAVQRLHR